MVAGPLVSVIIDNYNYGRFLRDSVPSALDQTYGLTEVIVVDDGSTDESRDILKGFGKDLRSIFKPNGGQASAFNAGLEESRGEVICLLDSDDLWDRGKVEEVVDAVRARAADGWGMLRHNMRVHTGSLTAAQRGASVVPGIRATTVESIHSDDVLIRRRNAPTSALAFPRRLWNRCGPVRPEEDFRISADAFLYTHLPRFGKVISLASELGTYRVHGDNNYVGVPLSQEQTRKIADIEFGLLRTLPSTVRLHNTLLALAHSDVGREDGYLRELGPVHRRLRRIIGTSSLGALRADVAMTACREVLRSVLP